MQLNEIQFKLRRKTRIGRGGKRGNTSGRGQKGQKSRSGRNIRPAERDLILRLPKLRGYKNKPLGDLPKIFNLRDLHKLIENNKVIDIDLFKKEGLIRGGEKKIKILGDGSINKSVEFRGFDVSKSARNKIEKAGGKIT